MSKRPLEVRSVTRRIRTAAAEDESDKHAPVTSIESQNDCSRQSERSVGGRKCNLEPENRRSTIVEGKAHEEEVPNPFDLRRVLPELVWATTKFDESDEEEAPVPEAFELYPDSDEEREQEAKRHRSAPLPDFYTLDNLPDDLDNLPPLEYYPMNPDVNPVRLLVLLPHFGNPYSVVQCNLFPVSLLEHHYCFAGIRNSRGNKNLTSRIVVNECVKSVTRNLEVFVRHFRRERHAMVIWVREICIDSCDLSQHTTPEWRDWILQKACKGLSMTDFMYQLEAQEVLAKEKKLTVRPKDWGRISREPKLPTHFPIALRTYTKEQIAGREEDVPVVPHQYLPLDLVAEEIRLIVLMPSSDTEAPLVAHLAHESISGPASYHCLSYTWGNEQATERLVLSGQLIMIRPNLAKALKAMRPKEPGQQVTVWVDAVCINQGDFQERNRQVARMHEIYDSADVVCVWLGDASADSDLAMDFAKTLDTRDSSVFTDMGDASGLRLVSSLHQATRWAALYRLLQRPYFRRAWSIQELSVASVPSVSCGDKTISWYRLHQASLAVQTFGDQIRSLCRDFALDLDRDQPTLHGALPGCPNCSRARLPHNDLALAHKLTWYREMRKAGRKPSFLSLCLLNRDAECTNPRDKIFALWNLAAESASFTDFTPDYTLSVRDVFINFTKAYIETTGSLDIICAPQNFCDHGQELIALPYWAPDWRVRSAVNSFIRMDNLPVTDTEELLEFDRPLYQAALDTKAEVKFSIEGSQNVLECRAILVDVIIHVSEEIMDPLKWFDEAQVLCHRNGEPLPDEVFNKQFTSMTMGDASCMWESDESRTRMRWTGESLSHEDTIAKSMQMLPGKAMRSPIKARTLIVTEKGYMGLAPYWARDGMELAILMGCNVPVLLERCGANDFHVRGDCFVQGWMNGEMLEGLVADGEKRDIEAAGEGWTNIRLH